MARDEALLSFVGAGTSPATLRFYQWSSPTISLGYFQSFAEYASLPPPAGGLPIVRRLTGGGAILHDRELTYSLVLPAGHPLARLGPRPLYEVVHGAIVDALGACVISARMRGRGARTGRSQRNRFFCFAREYAEDVISRGEKLAGSAQRRLRSAVLQHGSLILESRFDQQPSGQVCSQAPVSVRTLIDLIVESLSGRYEFGRQPDSWTCQELVAASALNDKYAGEAWTKRR